jgi:aminopeptidase YwaD
LERLQHDTDLTFRFSETPGASSDHLSFARKNIPVLFFFSGLHADYHKPTDTWQQIKIGESQEIIGIVQGVFEALDGLIQPLRSVNLARESDTFAWAGTGPSQALGAILDLSWGLEGVRVDEVYRDKPAGLAGLKRGDIIVEAGGRRILSIHDLGFALQVENQQGPLGLAIVRDGNIVYLEIRRN